MNPPAFSIVIPTYQRRDIVCDAVRAVMRLEYAGPVELIVVVDGSTDGTSDALRRIAGPVPFKIVEQANAGAAAARNRGAEQATGEVLLFLDDDMMCQPDLLDQHARCHAGGADGVIGDFVLDEASPPGFLADGIAEWSGAFRDGCAAREEIGACDLSSGQFSIRREAFSSVGGFDEALTHGGNFAAEDVDLGARLLTRYRLVHNPLAITRQRYVVTPADLMDRAFKMGKGAAAMARRHPAVMADYVADRKASEPRTRFLYRPLSRLPGAARVLASIAGRAGGLILRTRWRGSRAFARLFNAAGHIAFWSAFERETGLSSRRSVMVLCYHAIADHSADPVLAPYSVAPELFRRQIDWLRRRGHRFIAPQDLLDFLDGKAVPPRKAVLVTFDDCYRDLADTVRTELAPRGIPALAFCVAGIASNSNEWDRPRGARRLALLTAAELAALRGEGLEVGSHALTHRALTTLPRPEMARELGASVEALERAGLPRPRFLAYPYGDRDAATRVEARRAGFALAFGTDGSRVDRLSDRFDIPRVTMMASDRGLRLWLKIEAPGLLAWLVDRKAALRSRFT